MIETGEKKQQQQKRRNKPTKSNKFGIDSSSARIWYLETCNNHQWHCVAPNWSISWKNPGEFYPRSQSFPIAITCRNASNLIGQFNFSTFDINMTWQYKQVDCSWERIKYNWGLGHSTVIYDGVHRLISTRERERERNRGKKSNNWFVKTGITKSGEATHPPISSGLDIHLLIHFVVAVVAVVAVVTVVAVVAAVVSVHWPPSFWNEWKNATPKLGLSLGRKRRSLFKS